MFALVVADGLASLERASKRGAVPSSLRVRIRVPRTCIITLHFAARWMDGWATDRHNVHPLPP